MLFRSRHMRGAVIAHYQPVYRLLLGKLYGALVKAVVGLHGINDTQCGFKMFTAKAVEHIVPQCRINGWSFDVEMLVVAQRLGYPIKELPITWSSQSESKMRLKSMAFSLIELMKIKQAMLRKTEGGKS